MCGAQCLCVDISRVLSAEQLRPSAQVIAHTETCFPQHVLPFGFHSRLIDNSPLFLSPKHPAPPPYKVANTSIDKWTRTHISLLYRLHITFPVMASPPGDHSPLLG